MGFFFFKLMHSTIEIGSKFDKESPDKILFLFYSTHNSSQNNATIDDCQRC